MRIDAGMDRRDHDAPAIGELLRLRQLDDAERGLRDVAAPHRAAEVVGRGAREGIENFDRRRAQLRNRADFGDDRRTVKSKWLTSGSARTSFTSCRAKASIGSPWTASCCCRGKAAHQKDVVLVCVEGPDDRQAVAPGNRRHAIRRCAEDEFRLRRVAVPSSLMVLAIAIVGPESCREQQECARDPGERSCLHFAPA